MTLHMSWRLGFESAKPAKSKVETTQGGGYGAWHQGRCDSAGMRLEGPVVEPEVLGNREHLDISTGLEDSWALASVVPAGLVT
jgi:hypothetical protein